jgi:hypothetical protein
LGLIPENPIAGTEKTEGFERHSAVSALPAALLAFHDTVDLLLRPFCPRQWLKFSLLCLALAGGTPSAAFDWSLGALPSDMGVRQFTAHAREYLARHLWLVALGALVILGTGIFLLFLRASFRFILVGAIIQRRIAFGPLWQETRTLRHSYFRWLLGVLGAAGFFITLLSLLSFPYLRVSAAEGLRSVTFWILLAIILATDILAGLFVAVVITLTDDLAVPIMYTGKVLIAPAWRRLLEIAGRNPWAFISYIAWRFALSLLLGILVMFLVFSALVTLFSGAIITSAAVVLTLHAWGAAWAWNVATVAIAGTGLGIIILAALLVLSLVSMPAQVFLQSFGMRFTAAHVPLLEVLLIRPESSLLSPFEVSGINS